MPVKSKIPISITHPGFLEEWDYNKNNGLSPDNITAGSDKKAWWICKKDNSHNWQASISHRAHGRGCPFCAGKKVNSSNSLQTLYPELSKEWHPTKNKILTPNDVRPGTHQKVWWKCSKNKDHEWLASINNRVKGKGCPYCSGRMASNDYSLVKTHPKIAREWCYEKNGNVTPDKVTKGVVKSYWWKCPEDETHIYKASPNNRTRGKDCPYCSGRKVNDSNSLATLRPELVKEWNEPKNGNLSPKNFTISSHKKVWWKCPKDSTHEWQSVIANRAKGIGCPFCSNQKLNDSNSLQNLYPELSKEWHPFKNGNIKPNNVIAGGHKKVWWKCNKGIDHEWEATVFSRVTGGGCPICRGLKVVKSNSLEFLYPRIAKEWHPEKNGALKPTDVYFSSNKRVWWKCNKGIDHEWLTSLYHRVKNKSGCPFCTLTPQSRQELTILFELKSIFNSINPKGFKTRINGKIWSIDIFIPHLNLGIEFDGSHWHKHKSELDKMKTKHLTESGLTVIRIREEPLKKVNYFDILSPKKFDAKHLTNQILVFILNQFKLNTSQVNKINKYIKSDYLLNEKCLDKYIDSILTHKAKISKKKT